MLTGKVKISQLIMRNEPRGSVWQCYHVQTEQEIRILTQNARANGFIVEQIPEWRAHIDGVPECPEGVIGWRDSPEWAESLRKDQDAN